MTTIEAQHGATQVRELTRVGNRAAVRQVTSTTTVKRSVWAQRVKRALDVVVSVAGLVLALPVMLVLALAIKCSSPGPILFVHERVGAGGRAFKLYKLRTMVDGAHEQILSNRARYAEYRRNDFKVAADDPGITRLGGVLRRTSLDELPQLFNVLRGDMSMVGIRPLVPAELDQRSERDRSYYCRARPGLTGLWQVEGRSSVLFDDRLDLDRCYFETWSLRNDLMIVAKTPIAVLRTADAA